jgi:hypothetical protein
LTFYGLTSAWPWKAPYLLCQKLGFSTEGIASSSVMLILFNFLINFIQ